MYLNNLFAENIGNIQSFKLEQDNLFRENFSPKPIVLVGKNWSWKTSLLSSIADAFFELATHWFDDVLPEYWWGGHKYFKINWGSNQRLWCNYWFVYAQFTTEEKQYEYLDKSGKITWDDCKSKTNNLLELKTRWKDDWGVKETSDDEDIENEFKINSYCFFPADRFEIPHWMNRDTLSYLSPNSEVNNFRWVFSKDMFAKKSLDKLKTWILDLFLDSRADLEFNEDGSITTRQKLHNLHLLQQWIKNIEEILSIILRREVELDVNIRGSGTSRLKIIDKNTQETLIPSLDNLSAGESTLLAIFASIIKLSDVGDVNKSIRINEIEWIILIDEIDLHLHIELQKEILPKLLAKFPQVQFIVSTHSPFFLAGMQKQFWEEALFINMSTGRSFSNIDDFEEFNKAYEIFTNLTNDYKDEVEKLKQEIWSKERPLILCEWKTDVIHIKKAMEVLNITDLDIEIFEVPDDFWDSKLERLLESYTFLAPSRKIIGIFDRDKESIVRKYAVGDQELKDFWNNVYAFCLPIPDFRRQYNNISIEFYYPDDNLKTKKDGRCLYFDNEINFDANRKIKGIDNNAIDNNSKKIYDQDIWSTQEIHSKTTFAGLVGTDQDFIKDFDFSNFNLIFDKIRSILSK